jgi:hypothetical protein
MTDWLACLTNTFLMWWLVHRMEQVFFIEDWQQPGWRVVLQKSRDPGEFWITRTNKYWGYQEN